jgi:hypothetical protein
VSKKATDVLVKDDSVAEVVVVQTNNIMDGGDVSGAVSTVASFVALSVALAAALYDT